jgi:hypothetical protein
LKSVKEQFNALADFKYRKGQSEHGGNLFEMKIEALLDNAIYEAIDQVVYLFTLKERLFNSKDGYITPQ